MLQYLFIAAINKGKILNTKKRGNIILYKSEFIKNIIEVHVKNNLEDLKDCEGIHYLEVIQSLLFYRDNNNCLFSSISEDDEEKLLNSSDFQQLARLLKDEINTSYFFTRIAEITLDYILYCIAESSDVFYNFDTEELEAYFSTQENLNYFWEQLQQYAAKTNIEDIHVLG